MALNFCSLLQSVISDTDDSTIVYFLRRAEADDGFCRAGTLGKMLKVTSKGKARGRGAVLNRAAVYRRRERTSFRNADARGQDTAQTSIGGAVVSLAETAVIERKTSLGGRAAQSA